MQYLISFRKISLCHFILSCNNAQENSYGEIKGTPLCISSQLYLVRSWKRFWEFLAEHYHLLLTLLQLHLTISDNITYIIKLLNGESSQHPWNSSCNHSGWQNATNMRPRNLQPSSSSTFWYIMWTLLQLLLTVTDSMTYIIRKAFEWGVQSAPLE